DITATGTTTAISLQGGAELNGQNLLLTSGGAISIGGVVRSSGGGAGDKVLIRGTTAATSIGLGDDATGSVTMNEASLANIAAEFDLIEVGRSGTQSGTIVINDVSDDDVLTMLNALTLQADGGAVLTLSSGITTGGGSLII